MYSRSVAVMMDIELVHVVRLMLYMVGDFER